MLIRSQLSTSRNAAKPALCAGKQAASHKVGYSCELIEKFHFFSIVRCRFKTLFGCICNILIWHNFISGVENTKKISGFSTKSQISKKNCKLTGQRIFLTVTPKVISPFLFWFLLTALIPVPISRTNNKYQTGIERHFFLKCFSVSLSIF
jgi:hypothetical protein